MAYPLSFFSDLVRISSSFALVYATYSMRRDSSICPAVLS